MHRMNRGSWYFLAVAGLALGLSTTGVAFAQEGEKKPDFPPFAEVSKDYVQVVSTADGVPSLYSVWRREKDGQMLAELPRNYQSQKHFIAMTVATGDMWAGLQGGDLYFYWRRYDNRLAMVQPNMDTRSTGDQESKAAVDRTFTDRVILDIPIVAMGPNGQPVIDLDGLLVGQIGQFFGPQAAGANARLATIKEAKAFPKNIEVAYELPTSGGALKSFHYSISVIEDNAGYKPRVADERVGFFTTSYRDLGKFRDDQKWVRYVNRWHLEKADPSLKLSPPKEPIVFYVEHTTPVRYRRYVREGALMWNKAFERIGIKDAVEVYLQDKTTGAHMEKDPEDVRYNFLRWLSNDVGTAIGPSRVNPNTGQILDADVVLTDGWIRHFWYQYNELLPEVAMEGFSPETLAWLNRNPNWDPRVRLADPSQRDFIIAQNSMKGVMRFGGHPAANIATNLLGDDEYDGLIGRTSQVNGMCMASTGKAVDMAMMGLHMQILELIAEDPPADGTPPAAEGDKKDEEPKKDDKTDLLDGVPDWFVGPMLADLVAHEVGHTLGLRHNFRASSLYSMAQINSDEIKGKKPYGGSVMDYNPVNINLNSGPTQGDYTMIDVGPYDLWAIEYGYTLGDTKEVLKRVAEPELTYLTDEDTMGPDPLARRYDFSADPLEYAKNQIRLCAYYRERLLTKFVKDGDSWSKARRGYSITLNQQMSMLSMMSRWVGGAYVHRDRKGDPNGRTPTDVVPVEKQRAALQFMIDNAFKDEAFGLTPDLLAHLTVDKWADAGGESDFMEDPTWPVHDRIMGIQSAALTMMMNPGVLGHVFDNEFRTPANQDAVTLPEVMDKVSDSIWTEINSPSGSSYTAREPMISSLRRNLQREHLERLIDLTLPESAMNASGKAVANLAVANLRKLSGRIGEIAGKNPGNLDPYTLAHLSEAKVRIDKALDAQYIYNAASIGGGGGMGGFFFAPQTKEAARPTVEAPAEPSN